MIVRLTLVFSGFAVVMAEAPSDAAQQEASVVPGMSSMLVQTCGD